ncbi:T9SS type A sorting domain-containing protein [Polaribacter haliotis]|uniref:T9SS type A sorting domain-containing protein n=1 Tax=Polaribacter haliotis TaxID=1888915 RepID=A0A7L8ACI2_9FLAO|nr:T9SS type A sorting domain-containing protein [Polaribacter haliotis]QOD59617.1 T9SS type A sorting domain-containing protein [Polaribacter haliotis]
MKRKLLLPILFLTINIYCQELTIIDKNLEKELIEKGFDNNGFDGTITYKDAIKYREINKQQNKKTISNLTYKKSTSLSSEIVKIPDILLKNALLAEPAINTNNDDEIQITEAEAVNFALDGSNKGITNLTGIEAFINLPSVNLANNSLTSIDISKNTKLKSLFIQNNNLGTIIFGENSNLEDLYAPNNKFASLDLSKATKLKQLRLFNNQNLMQLDLKNGNNTNLTVVDLTNNSNLGCIQVDDPVYSQINWSNIDSKANFNSNCNYIEVINIPNQDFEFALIDMGFDDIIDGYILKTNANKIESLNVRNYITANYEGVKYFNNLTRFLFSNSQVKIIDFTGLQKLEYIGANNTTTQAVLLKDNPELKSLNLNFNNALVYTNLSGCINLDNFQIGLTSVKDIDLSKNINLTSCFLALNKIEKIDVSKNVVLESFFIYSNNLQQLDLSKNIKLKSLGAYSNNINTITIPSSIESINLSQNNFSSFDATALTNLETINVNNQKVDFTVLNINGLTKLKGLDIAGSKIGNTINTNAFLDLERLNIENCDFSRLDVTNNLKLIYLYANNNSIDALDITKNTLLEEVYVNSNKLENIDVSKNEKLGTFSINDNIFIKELDFGNCPITILYAKNITNLEKVNLNNGFNKVASTIELLNAPNLTCVQVDDVAYAVANFTDVDANSVFNSNCGFQTSNNLGTPIKIEDQNFEYALVNLGFDDVYNGYILKSEALKIEELNLNNRGIVSLKGITEFDNLKDLQVHFNPVISVDLSGLQKLESYQSNTFDNTLLEIKLQNNSALKTLALNGHVNLESLNLSEASNLENLEISNSAKLTVDVKTSPNLKLLRLDRMGLSSIDLLTNTALVSLTVTNNSITSIDIPNKQILKILNLNTNNLSSFNGALYPNLEYLNLRGNKITPININTLTNLINLNLATTDLATLDIGNLLNLEILNVTTSGLKVLDVTKNLKLTQLYAGELELQNIDLTKNTLLTHINFFDVYLENLDLSNNLELRDIFLTNNNLQKLDLSKHTKLEFVTLESNKLTDLNLRNGNNEAIIVVNTKFNNALSCIKVDDVAKAEAKLDWQKDTTTSYNTNCGALNADNVIVQKISFYPNPVNDILQIKNSDNLKISTIMIFNVLGKKVKVIRNPENAIDVSDLSKGIYFLNINSENGKIVKRIIKK